MTEVEDKARELSKVDVSRLTRTQREQRVSDLVVLSHEIIDDAVRVHAPHKQLAFTAVLFSGGNDSTVLAHLMRHRADYAIHANTTIGIEQTRQFVRDTCAGWGLPLIEEMAPISYTDLVVNSGFPGPALHWFMYQRLKERGLRLARHRLGIARARKRFGLFLAGRRWSESARRSIPGQVLPHNDDGAVVWASPLVAWTKADLNTYRAIHADLDPVPVNEVSDLIHMSGECLCGSFAHRGELDELGYWFPDVRAEIEEIENRVAAAGHTGPLARWGHGIGTASRSGPMCDSCDARYQPSVVPL